MIVDTDIKLDFDDVLIVPRYSDLTSRKDVVLDRTIISRHSYNHITGIPIIAANMDGVGTFSMAHALHDCNMFTAINKNETLQNWDFFLRSCKFLYEDGAESPHNKVFITIGNSKEDLNKLVDIVDMIDGNFGIFEYQPKINIDVANGYMNSFYDHVSQVRKLYPHAFIIAGTVCTPEATQRMIQAGADRVRVGIGSGAVCTTRRVTGIGYPQFSAVLECATAAKEFVGGGIVSDGGCVNAGDFSKAFCAGADMVMAGSVFSGHKESEIIPEDGKIVFYGMSSRKYQEDNNIYSPYKTSEGRVVSLPFKGVVRDTVLEILGGIRSTCCYIGAQTIEDMPKNAKFIRVNHQLNRSLEKYTIDK